MNNKKIFIALPAFKEEQVIQSVINEIQETGYKNIVIVDDGSGDDTYRKAKETGTIVVQHIINRGKGAATQTAIDAALKLKADIIVTMDSDGQHNPKEIKSLIKPLLDNQADVVIGSRMLNAKDMPISRKLMNIIANLVTFFFFGIYVTDSQSGFRAYTSKSLKNVYTYLDRYEFESEMLGQIRKQRIKEVPIEVRYSAYSYNKYNNVKNFTAQGLLNGISMFVRMIENSIFK